MDMDTVDRLQAILQGPVEAAMGSRGEILKKLMEYQDHYKVSIVQHMLNTAVDKGVTLTKRLGIEIDNLAVPSASVQEENEKSTVVKSVNLILLEAFLRRASDIHIIPTKTFLKVFYRVDGVLQPAQTLPLALAPSVVSRIKVMSKLDIMERRMPQDGSFHIKVENREIDFRVAVTPTINGEKVVLRILDKGVLVVGLDNIGFNPHMLNALKRIIRKTYGIILMSGPTGSGKTTTLYSALQALNTGTKNITTVEDPVEYEIEGVTQIQMHSEIGLNFTYALRSILRQDPDIILVGEIRDLETAEIAIRASLTGHLVFSTIHTNDAPSAVVRLVEMGVPPYLIASSLRAVISQRLVRTLCLRCKKETVPTEDDKKAFLVTGHTPHKIFYAPGCRNCFNTGFRGRTVISELLEMNEGIRKLVVEKETASKIKEESIKNGMVTMFEDGVQKILSGVTTLSEVLEVTEMVDQ